jgi:hypothetical protein
MDNQPLTPIPPGQTPVTPATASLPPLPTGGSMLPTGGFGGGRGGTSPVFFILIALFAIGTLVFGVMAVANYNQAQNAQKTVNKQVSAAVVKAKQAQKKLDDEANAQANESPYRSYVAPTEYGSFEIKFPKVWSSYIDQEPTGKQVSLVMNPDFVRRTNNTDELVAARVQLIEQTKDSFMQQFTSLVKRNVLKQADTTISGQKAFDLTGAFADKKTTRMVVVPVRDKVLVFYNENSKYGDEFSQILAQSKVIP